LCDTFDNVINKEDFKLRYDIRFEWQVYVHLTKMFLNHNAFVIDYMFEII